MTLVSQIIIDAFRQGNLLAVTASPTTAQSEEALRHLDRIVKSVLGNEAGDPLTAFPVGRVGFDRPAGYPGWDTVPDNEWFVPKNTRVMLNLEQSIDLYLHPAPDDGSRFAIIDVNQSLGTYPVTIHGNGALIDGAASLVLNDAGYNGEWFYRADLATWKIYSPLELTTTFPFPEEFDNYFITLLASHLNPTYGAAMDDQVTSNFKRSQVQLRARYKQSIPTPSELALLRLSRVAADRDRWGNVYTIFNPNDMFNRGYPW